MSQAKELPERFGFQLRKEEDKRLFRRAHERVADVRDVDPSDMSRRDVVVALAENYLDRGQNSRLLEDQRIQQARRAVANDHGKEPEAVSLRCLTKVACGAYMGYQTADDWELDGERHD